MTRTLRILLLAAGILLLTVAARAEVCNIKVVTDASPDYTDMQSMIHSVTARWETTPQKLYAMYWWNHIARRQVPPMYQHGLEVTDPIRQFNDYGYTQCSTISGINCGIWHNMGFDVRYNDIAGHTVPEVFYDNKWHVYDNSEAMLCTLCDGKTIAGIDDIRKEAGCEASSGKVEKYHCVLYHCLFATNPNGFQTGEAACRSLGDLAGCYRNGGWVWWMNNWDWGHRYILNLKPNEVYTRFYARQEGFDPRFAYDPKVWKSDPKYFVPNPASPVKDDPDPERCGWACRIRGTGQWDYEPSLTAADSKDYYSLANVAFAQPAGLRPEKAGAVAESVFKVQSANVATSMEINAAFARKSGDDVAQIAVSTDNGLHWADAWTAKDTGNVAAKLTLIKEVNGAYEILVKVRMSAKADLNDVTLKSIHIRTFTQINSKTQPRLNIGKNTIYVGAGDQTESIVIWPELVNDKYKEGVVDSKNIRTEKNHPLYDPVLMPANRDEEGYLTYKLAAPGDITRVVIGGRYRPMENNDKGKIAFLYSLDDGKTWATAWELTSKTNENPKANKGTPVDEIHHQTVDIPKGNKCVLVKYSMFKFGLWNLRAEADYLPGDGAFKPMEVTFTWNEKQKDYSLVKRSHTQLVEKLPCKYEINVGGADHPEMVSLGVNLKGAAGVASTQPVKYGYSDGKDNADAKRYVGTWVTYGKNLAEGKKYAYSVPQKDNWAGANDKDGTRLTDGYVGPPMNSGACWSRAAGMDMGGPDPEITLDLGKDFDCAAIGLQTCGDNSLTGGLSKNCSVEVLTSTDNKDFKSVGMVNMDMRFKDIPYNYLLADDESLAGGKFYVPLDKSVKARYVKYKIKVKGGMFFTTELFVHDSVKVTPFDIGVALPDEQPRKAK